MAIFLSAMGAMTSAGKRQTQDEFGERVRRSSEDAKNHLPGSVGGKQTKGFETPTAAREKRGASAGSVGKCGGGPCSVRVPIRFQKGRERITGGFLAGKGKFQQSKTMRQVFALGGTNSASERGGNTVWRWKSKPSESEGGNHAPF